MQLLCTYEISGFDAWKTAFDDDADARREAGLTVLQIWRDADSDSRAFVLLGLTDRPRAQAWLDRSEALRSDDAGTVTATTAHFLATA
ncbi:hypothetical protein ACFSUD_12360 [Sulfitobacter aestuarii]|uniref:DUF3303 domain-containing protein n=1 Tax=Sulfitobacter aestuarii TaxID=2161676 RepID=A0ABW5U383_9RHOB